MNRKWIVAFLIYAGLIAICCLVVYAVPSVKGILEKTYIAEYGTVDVKDEVDAFIVRDETVYTAARESTVNRKAESGTLVKAGTSVVELAPAGSGIEEIEQEEAEENADKIIAPAEKIVELGESVMKDKKEEDSDKKTTDKNKDSDKSGDEDADAEEEPEEEDVSAGKYNKIMEDIGDAAIPTETGATTQAGYVSYYVDGAETKLNTDSFEGLKLKDYKSLSGKNAIETPDSKAGKGYPVFKIVNNKKWYLVFYLDNDDAAKYTEGGTVTVDLNGEPVTVTVSRVLSGTKTSRITLTCKTFFEGFLETRKLDTKVTVSSASGLMLYDSSIVEAPDGTHGVFVVNKLGEHVYTPVRIKADDGVKCVAYSDIYVDDDGNFVETIGTYDEIVSEPTEEDLEKLPAKKATEDSGDSN